MKETRLSRVLQCYAVRGLIDVMWVVMLFSPLYIPYMWRFWWLRPIFIWYLPFTVFICYTYTIFPPTALFCALTNGGKTSFLGPFFMKFVFIHAILFFKFFHGIDIRGLKNLPSAGGLVVYYHAAFVPVDLCYLLSYVYLKFGRMIGGSVDYNAFFRQTMEFYEFTTDREQFVKDLKNGALRSVAPGGAYEGMFSKNYSLEWRCRSGFAKIAKETGVPVVPMFTTNLQHAMPLLEFNRSDTMKKWYAMTKRPLFVPKVYLPVKMTIHLGEQLFCGKDEAPEAFAERVKKAIENLRDKYQPKHQTSLDALRERLR